DGLGGFDAYYPYESGLYADGDVKQTSLIRIKGQPHLLLAINNKPMKIIRIGKKRLTENEIADLAQQ
ncbi:hypothetical protein QQ020_36090, partial [Fulvivirgaceae bacterium BMA12]|nr:hypothetical protein [Fulvivirgaceae bacterium BMA12]